MESSTVVVVIWKMLWESNLVAVIMFGEGLVTSWLG